VVNGRLQRPLGRALIVVALSSAHFGALFRLADSTFWTSGLGDWQDPYFINFLLEHWYQSARHLTNPASPPIFFPARDTLGYSCSLILYAPFYLLVRPFVDAFQAYGLTLVLVAETGTICLYLLLRRWMRLSFVAALLLTAYFVTAQNVINGLMFAWSQRATVFLIPVVILVLLESRRMRPGPARTVLAATSGCLCALVPITDFPTGYLAVLVAVMAFGPAMTFAAAPYLRRAIGALPSSRAARLLLLLAGALAAWSLVTVLTGGISTQFFGIRISSRHSARPAVAAVLALAAFLYVDRFRFARAVVQQTRTWGLPFTIGLAVGAAIFLRIYLRAYREHPAFPKDEMLAVLTPASQLLAYDSARPFVFVLAMTALAWLPWSRVGRRARAAASWFLFAALLVLLMPLRFDQYSLWTTVVQRLPGAGGVRDATRIMDPFELAVVLGTGLLLARTTSRFARLCTVALLAIVLVSGWQTTTFDFSRPNHTYAQWVESPIAIDPSCRAFFILPASRAYSPRPNSAWSVYGLDAMFIALRHRLPTLNGYSGWAPEGWAVANPEVPGYLDVAARWINDHALTGVCALDIERRTMRPFVGGGG
jgi:hypothetical protein